VARLISGQASQLLRCLSVGSNQGKPASSQKLPMTEGVADMAQRKRSPVSQRPEWPHRPKGTPLADSPFHQRSLTERAPSRFGFRVRRNADRLAPRVQRVWYEELRKFTRKTRFTKRFRRPRLEDDSRSLLLGGAEVLRAHLVATR